MIPKISIGKSGWNRPCGDAEKPSDAWSSSEGSGSRQLMPYTNKKLSDRKKPRDGSGNPIMERSSGNSRLSEHVMP